MNSFLVAAGIARHSCRTSALAQLHEEFALDLVFARMVSEAMSDMFWKASPLSMSASVYALRLGACAAVRVAAAIKPPKEEKRIFDGPSFD